MATTKTKAELEAEIEEKDNIVNTMQEQLNLLMKQVQEMVQNQNTKGQSDSNIDNIIMSNKKIKVISLIDCPLYLTTEEYGAGKKFEFPYYGYEHNIKFNDLEDIVHITRSFAESGVYYIADKNVVDELGLEDAYKKILTKDKIDEIIDLESEMSVKLFAGARGLVQDSIVDNIAKNIKDGKHYDLNLLSKISEIYGRDVKEISERIVEIKK